MTLIYAHRGSAGKYPENTMISFEKAAEEGADGIELDVHVSKDNELIVMHDHLVDRTTNGKGLIKEQTLQQLKQLDAGSWFADDFVNERIPTLNEVFDWLKQNSLIVNIELKNVHVDYPGIEQMVVELIEQYDMIDRVVVSSFNHIALHKVHEINAEIENAILFSGQIYRPWEYAKTVGAKSLHPYWRITDQEMISNTLANNMEIRPYTINKPAEIESFLKQNCSAVITDFPDIAVKLKDSLQ